MGFSTNAGKTPKIEWSLTGSFDQTLNFGYPLDFAVADSVDRAGSEDIQLISGEEVAWIVGTDYRLRFRVRWVETTDFSTQYGSATGWDGNAGWRKFLEFARQKNQFRFYPDDESASFILSYLADFGDVTLATEDGTRDFNITIRNPNEEYAGY